MIVVFGGSSAKIDLFRFHLKEFGFNLFSMPMNDRLLLANAEKDIFNDLSQKNGQIVSVMSMIDSLVPLADRLSQKMGLSGNDPKTSQNRCDKFAMQKALKNFINQSTSEAARPYGVRLLETYKCSSVGEGLHKWNELFHNNPVVLKPPKSGGCDGVHLCRSESEISNAIVSELGRVNIESIKNDSLILQEYLEPEGRVDFVVNTVSSNGKHMVTDIWMSVSKDVDKSGRFLYDKQELVNDGRDIANVVDFAFLVLEAVGLKFGAAHLEISSQNNQFSLIEIDARIAGEVRTSYLPKYVWNFEDQLYWLSKSIADPFTFNRISEPFSIPTSSMRVISVFLKCPLDTGYLYFQQFLSLRSFFRFGRGLNVINGYLKNTKFLKSIKLPKVVKTVDLLSCPGVVILIGEFAEDDAYTIRRWEAESGRLYRVG